MRYALALSLALFASCTSNNPPANSCRDGVLDGHETDIDCGGPVCGACTAGERCVVNADCDSAVCTAGVCAALVHTGGAIPPSSTIVYRIQPNASTVVQPGTQAGFGITANVGGSYRLVWTGDVNTSGTYHEFWGSVWTTGTFSSVVPGCSDQSCPLETNDFVGNAVAVTGGQRIDFDTFATDGLDGFDFVASVEPVYFNLVIDGVSYPNLVFFPATDNGGAISNVGAIPFGLTTQ